MVERADRAVEPEVNAGDRRGVDLTKAGQSWKPLDQEKYNSVGFTSTSEGWAVGPKGRIAKFTK